MVEQWNLGKTQGTRLRLLISTARVQDQTFYTANNLKKLAPLAFLASLLWKTSGLYGEQLRHAA